MWWLGLFKTKRYWEYCQRRRRKPEDIYNSGAGTCNIMNLLSELQQRIWNKHSTPNQSQSFCVYFIKFFVLRLLYCSKSSEAIIYLTKNKKIACGKKNLLLTPMIYSYEEWVTALFVANSSLPPVCFHVPIEKSCHLSHCCSQQLGQVEEFMLDEQCCRGVLKQRRRFDVSDSPRRTKK